MTTSIDSPDRHDRRLFVVGAIAALLVFGFALYAWSQGVDSNSLSIGTGTTDGRAAGSTALTPANTP